MLAKCFRGSRNLVMALCRAVGLTLKAAKPLLVNPYFIIPSSVNLQVRHAARKGYREKANSQRKQKKLEKAAKQVEDTKNKKMKLMKFEKTIIQNKPEPPNDDIFIRDDFNYKKYTLSEIIGFHKEFHHPTVYNNPEAPIVLQIEIDMTGKKKTQFLKPFSGIAAMPHPFVLKHKKEVLVLCGPEYVELALKCGASVAGSNDIIKKIQEGIIQPSLYDYVIAHTNFLPQLTPIRKLLKDKLPKARMGTLTNNLESAINRFLHGIEYSCVKCGTSDDFGFIQCAIGMISMDKEQLEDNFKALIEDIETKRPPRDGDFITWVWCVSPPSNEKFLVDLSKYAQTSVVAVDDDEDDADDAYYKSEAKEEADAMGKLRNEYEGEKVLNF